jgi:hypothetical protein
VDSLAARQLVIDTIGCWPRTIDSDAANHPAVTPTATTPNDGWHLWYRHEPGMRNVVRRGGEKLDARGDGGYVVVPPSSFGRYGYRWGVSPFVSEGGIWPPAPMPHELAELLWPKPRPHVARRPAPTQDDQYLAVAFGRECEAVRSASAGTRNDQLNRSAFALARFIPRISAEELESDLLAAARDAGLPEAEARRTISSAIRGRA